MNIEEVKSKAEAGNIGAMMELAAHYMSLNSAEGYFEAEEWYEKASEKGSNIADTCLVDVYAIVATLVESSNLGANIKRAEWRKAFNKSVEVQKFFDENQNLRQYIDYNSIVRKKKNSAYHIAVYDYFFHDYEEIAVLALDEEDDKSAIVLGMTNYVNDKNMENTEKTYILLDHVMSPNYLRAEKNDLEDFLFAEAIIALSVYCRNGYNPNNQTQDLSTAVEFLNYGLENVKDSDGINNIKSELEHYRLGIFGGYKYVE